MVATIQLKLRTLGQVALAGDLPLHLGRRHADAHNVGRTATLRLDCASSLLALPVTGWSGPRQMLTIRSPNHNNTKRDPCLDAGFLDIVTRRALSLNRIRLHLVKDAGQPIDGLQSSIDSQSAG